MAKYQSRTFFRPFGKNESNFQPKCHSIIFKNTGDRRAKINNSWVLEPGEETPSISTANPEVIDLTSYEIVFDTDSGGIAPMVMCLYTQIQPYNPNGGTGNGDACDKF